MNTKVRFVRLKTGHIQLRYNNKFKCRGTRFAFGTGVKVENENHWSKVKQRQKPRTKSSTPRNNRLNFLESRLVNLLSTYAAKGVNPTIAELKKEFKQSIGQGDEEYTKEEKITFLDFIDKFIINQKNIGNKSKGTFKNYQTTRNGIAEYLKYKKTKKLDFEDVNMRFANDFITFLKTERGIKSNNTVDSYIKHIKLFMLAAKKEKYHNSSDYTEIKRLRSEVENIFLTEEDIYQIAQLDLSKVQKLDRVRDIFLIGCSTGLRFSDYINISENQIIKKDNDRLFLSIITRKTKAKVVIPISPLALSVFEKYNFNLPSPITNQKFNEYIKEICQLAGITEMVSIQTGGGLKEGPKYQFVSTHTARRSFATNAFLNRVPTVSIMRITGHKTEKEFQNYIKIGNLESATHVSNLPFFSQDYKERKNNDSPLRKVS